MRHDTTPNDLAPNAARAQRERRMPASDPPSPRLRMVTLLGAVAVLVAGAALLPGCIILDGTSLGSSAGSGSSSGTSTPPVHHLPQPSIWRVDLPVLDADAQKRLAEVEQYLWDHYQAAGWQILDTTQTFLGDIYDWMDPASVQGSHEQPPSPPTPTEMLLPVGVLLQKTELDAFPELRGRAGTIPVLRPSFAAYVLGLSGATSLDDFLTKYVVPGAPPTAYDPNRLYAGMVSRVDNQGANATINSYYGLIEPGSMSVLEMTVGCRNAQDQMWQWVGIASSRDWATQGFANFGDFVLRLQVEFLTAGAGAVGNGIGGWAGTKSVTDFIPYEKAPYGPGAAFLPQMISTVGGPQYESLYQIKLLNGNWWVGHNGYWLGYYPGKLFGEGPSNLLASKACEVQWYGEVYANLVKTWGIWTYTDMGSGRFASEGWLNAAYFRDPSYVSLDAAGTWSWPPGDPKITSDITANLSNDKCYTKTALGSGPAPWEQFFYVGGPGREIGNQCQGPIPPP
ncbi:MAG: neprosin family prolyl endopeptidase [Byssovorax sp.]